MQYQPVKRLHADQLLASYSDRATARLVYEIALLSKPVCWAPEAEVRYVSAAYVGPNPSRDRTRHGAPVSSNAYLPLLAVDRKQIRTATVQEV